MTSTENTYNKFLSSRSAFKEQIKNFQINPFSWPYSRNSSLIKPKPVKNYVYISNISLTKKSTLMRINSSFCSLKSKEDELFGNLFKQYKPKEENNEKLNQGKGFKLDPSKIFLNCAEPENENENEDSENISFFGQGKNEPKKENIQPNLNKIGAKFFINHNYGYKCSCTKTNCNRNYCECYNSGNFCIDCNCKNCENQPPEYAYTNKHPDDINSKNKKNKVICTCTKSGCNKNYCECFKSGNKCSSLCRCIGCENTKNTENKITYNYKCCSANNICIKKNKIYDLKNEIKLYKRMEVNIKNKLNEGKNCKITNAKRRREENKDEANVSKGKIKRKKNSEEIDLFNDSLFDNNGKVILKNINLLHL